MAARRSSPLGRHPDVGFERFPVLADLGEQRDRCGEVLVSGLLGPWRGAGRRDCCGSPPACGGRRSARREQAPPRRARCRPQAARRPGVQEPGCSARPLASRHRHVGATPKRSRGDTAPGPGARCVEAAPARCELPASARGSSVRPASSNERSASSWAPVRRAVSPTASDTASQPIPCAVAHRPEPAPRPTRDHRSPAGCRTRP
jgi:hypothetical protein